MGSDNAKTRSSTGARRIKKKAPPPEPDNQSVGSLSTEDAVERRSLQGSNGSANASVASSASSIRLNAALLHKQKLAKRSRYKKENSTTSGGMKASTIVTVVVFMSVVYYVVTAFAASDGTIAGIDVLGLITGTTVLQVDETINNTTHDIAPDDKKLYEEEAPKEESPDAALAALASGSGGSLWEGIVTGGVLEGEIGGDSIVGDNSTNTTLDNEATEERVQEGQLSDSIQMLTNGTVSEGQLVEGSTSEGQQLIDDAQSEGNNAPDTNNTDSQVTHGAMSMVPDQGLVGSQVSLLAGKSQDQGLLGSKVKGYDTNTGQQVTEGAEIDTDLIQQQMKQKLDAGSMTNSMIGDSSILDTGEGNLVQQSSGNLRGSTKAEGQLQETSMLRGSLSQATMINSELPAKVTGYATNLDGVGNDKTQNQQSSVGVAVKIENAALQGDNMLQQGSDGLTMQNVDSAMEQGADGMLQQNNGIAMQVLNQNGAQSLQISRDSVIENGVLLQNSNGILTQNDDGALQLDSNQLLSRDSTLQDNALSQQGSIMTPQIGDSSILVQGSEGALAQNGDTELAMQQYSNQLLMQEGDTTGKNEYSPQQGSSGVLAQNQKFSQGEGLTMAQESDGTLQQRSANQVMMPNIGSTALDASPLQQGPNALVTQNGDLSRLQQGGDDSMSHASDLGLQQSSNQRPTQSGDSIAQDSSLSQKRSSGMLSQIDSQQLSHQDSDNLMAENTDGTIQQTSNQLVTKNGDTALQNDAQLQQLPNKLSAQSSVRDSLRAQIPGQENQPMLQNGDGAEQSQMLRSAGSGSEMMRMQNSMDDSSGNGMSNQITAGVSNHGMQSMIGGGSIQNHQGMQPSQLQQRRRLQEVVEPVAQSPYEQMTPSALSEYVSNHAQYRNLANFEEDLPFQPSSQVPYFWHIHKSGGSSMKHLLTAIGMAQTRRGSDPICDDKADYIHLCPLNWGSAVNADASSIPGIERIRNLGLVYKDIPKLVVTTSRIYEALNIFDQHHRGRLFVVLRDPMERAVSKYYYTQIATWERNYNPVIANMTMIEYANSRLCFDNWITRRIINKMNPAETLTEGDLRLAKEFLRQKAMILLTDDYSTSVYRLAKYFGWNLNGEQRWWIDKYTKNHHVNKNPHPVPDKLSAEWGALRERHLLDIELYRYANALYHEQAKFIAQKFGPLELPEPIDPNLTDRVEPDESDVN